MKYIQLRTNTPRLDLTCAVRAISSLPRIKRRIHDNNHNSNLGSRAIRRLNNSPGLGATAAGVTEIPGKNKAGEAHQADITTILLNQGISIADNDNHALLSQVGMIFTQLTNTALKRDTSQVHFPNFPVSFLLVLLVLADLLPSMSNSFAKM